MGHGRLDAAGLFQQPTRGGREVKLPPAFRSHPIPVLVSVEVTWADLDRWSGDWVGASVGNALEEPSTNGNVLGHRSRERLRPVVRSLL